ncbi:hypothetical protein [Inquilinus sp.]|uniref:hypothetical protein n=1 Tax=Inquilinus sp. TaxID=1932117 RepID=UPI0031D1FD51
MPGALRSAIATTVGQVKRLCREAHKPFVPLRTASLASFAAAVGTMGQAAAAE